MMAKLSLSDKNRGDKIQSEAVFMSEFTLNILLAKLFSCATQIVFNSSDVCRLTGEDRSSPLMPTSFTIRS